MELVNQLILWVVAIGLLTAFFLKLNGENEHAYEILYLDKIC